jgi:hypothetical protein
MAGGYLVYHFNRRMTGARDNANRVKTYLSNNEIDLSAIEEPPSEDRVMRSPSMYDAEEIYIFGYIIAGSVLPSLLAWVLV